MNAQLQSVPFDKSDAPMITPAWANQLSADPTEHCTFFDALTQRLTAIHQSLEAARIDSDSVYGLIDDLKDVVAFIDAWRTWTAEQKERQS